MNIHLAELFKSYLALPSECQAAFDLVMEAGAKSVASVTPGSAVVTPDDQIAQSPVAWTNAEEMDAGPRGLRPAASLDHGRRSLIGGPELDLTLTDRFRQARFLNRWRPGPLMGVYVAGCQGTTALAKALQRPIFKLGVHVGSDATARLRELGRTRYGSARLEHGNLITDPGFEFWSAEPLSSSITAPGSPVGFGPNGLTVTCPADMSASAFDRAVARALSPHSLHTIVLSDGGQARCRSLGIDPAWLLRYTPLSGRGRRASACHELTVIKPRYDAERLVRIVEDIVYDHVVGAPSTIVALDKHRINGAARCSTSQSPLDLRLATSSSGDR